MIISFKHKGLNQLYNEDSKKGIIPEHYTKLRVILTALDEAWTLEHLNMPGFNLHPLHGDLAGYYSITVRANWRVIFQFNAERCEVHNVDYIDYH